MEERRKMLNDDISKKPQSHKDAVQAILGPLMNDFTNKFPASSQHCAEVVRE